MKRPTKLLIAFLLLLALDHSSNAQYTLAVYGDFVKYDSAVIIDLYKYRQESLLLKHSSTAIDSLRHEIFSLYDEIEVTSNIQSMMVEELSLMSKRIHNKDSIIMDQRHKIDLFYEESIKSEPFYKSPVFILGSGVITGIIIRSYF